MTLGWSHGGISEDIMGDELLGDPVSWTLKHAKDGKLTWILCGQEYFGSVHAPAWRSAECRLVFEVQVKMLIRYYSSSYGAISQNETSEAFFQRYESR